LSGSQFWQDKTLSELSQPEWEALCDGCGKCCLAKLEDEDTGEILFTHVACRLLDTESCRCTDYDNRLQKVQDCLRLSVVNVGDMYWLPDTCAYKLRARGLGLHPWHPLISGSPQSVHEAGVSVRGRVITEQYIHPEGLEEHIVNWVDPD
jgi:hypothetical protein